MNDSRRVIRSRVWTGVALIAVLSLVLAACTPGALRLAVGTCFDDPPSFDAVTDVTVRDCASPHDKEVIALQDIDDEAFYGDDHIEAISEGFCVGSFYGYVGVRYLDSPYDVGWFAPTIDSWRSGDREVICFVFDPAGNKITGSLNGAAQ